MRWRTDKIVDVIGAEDLRKLLEEQLPNDARNILRGTTFDAAKIVRDKAKANVPVESGNLRNAIVATRSRGTSQSVEASVKITHGKGAKHDGFYWRFVEFGTVTHPRAAHFVTRAVEEVRANYAQIFRGKFFKRLAASAAKRKGGR